MQSFDNLLDTIIEKQKNFQLQNISRDVAYRKKRLIKLKEAILKYETEIVDALFQDLHKSKEESYLTEISLVLNEINFHLKNLSKWAKPQRVKTPLFGLPSKTRLLHEPLGVSLILSPWNYPFQLIFYPLVGAISSGCSAILKPAPETPATVAITKKIVTEVFEPEHVSLVEPTMEENAILLSKRYDFIFFTGSPRVGKIIARAAAEHLTPTILELGGKSPCIVDEHANIEVTAKRIVFGKLINAGQTCIAPDYFYVHHSKKEALIQSIIKNIEQMYGKDTFAVRHFPRMINEQAVLRVSNLIDQQKIVYGGRVDVKNRFIEPTILDNITFDDPVMQEEIFGPLFAILSFSDINTVIDTINKHEKPLAMYYFGKEKEGLATFQKTSSGGGCINDTLMHITNHHVPFGGVGNSGMGKYHGKYSFDVFSNKRAVVLTPTWIDLPLKYAPFKHFNLIRKIM